jgi:hypothetical protein
VTPEEAAELQRKYNRKRRRWAKHVGIPFTEDLAEPDPGALALDDPEEG